MKIKRANIITRVLIIAVALYAGINLLVIKAQTAEMRALKERLEKEVSELTQTNAEYKYDIEHSGDPELIEDIARDKLGLVMPGEVIFYGVSK